MRRFFGIQNSEQRQVEVDEVRPDVIRSVEQPVSLRFEPLDSSPHEDSIEGQAFVRVESGVVDRTAPPVFADGELDRVDVEPVDALVDLDTCLKLRAPITVCRELTGGSVLVGTSGQKRLPVADRIASDAHCDAIELQIQLGFRGVAPDAPLENQEARFDRAVVEMIEAHPALCLEVPTNRLANVQIELRASFDVGCVLAKVRVRTHFGDVSARMNLGDAFVLDVAVQGEIAPRVLRPHRVDVDAVVAHPDLGEEGRDLQVLVLEALGFNLDAQDVFVLRVTAHLDAAVDLDVWHPAHHLGQLRSRARYLDSGDSLVRQFRLDSSPSTGSIQVGPKTIVLLRPPEAHPAGCFPLECLCPIEADVVQRLRADRFHTNEEV